MNTRYDAWLTALTNRDNTLVLLTLLAVALVAAWCFIDYLPARVRTWLRRIYLVGGVFLYGITILVTVGGVQ